jgi:TolB-like protein
MKNSTPFLTTRAREEFAQPPLPPETPQNSIFQRHIEKVARSVTFSRAGQLRLLLEWLGERSLHGNGAAPSEREVAMAVMNRQDFDPQTDSLVRKEMSRLREKLTRYYQTEGSQDEVRIRTGGGYLFEFDLQPHAAGREGKSCWLVLPFRSSVEFMVQAEQLLEEILVEICQRGGPELVASTTALAYRGRTGDIRQFAAECRADFVIEGSLRRRNEGVEATLWLVDGQSGRAVRSKRIVSSDSSDELPRDLARRTAAWLLEEEAAV